MLRILWQSWSRRLVFLCGFVRISLGLQMHGGQCPLGCNLEPAGFGIRIPIQQAFTRISISRGRSLQREHAAFPVERFAIEGTIMQQKLGGTLRRLQKIHKEKRKHKNRLCLWHRYILQRAGQEIQHAQLQPETTVIQQRKGFPHGYLQGTPPMPISA